MQSKAAKDFPHQAPTEQLEQERWGKEHPRPDGQKDAAAWKAYYAAEVEHVKAFLRDFPDDPYLQRSEFFITVQDDEYVSEADGLAAVDRYLKAMEEYGRYGILSAGKPRRRNSCWSMAGSQIPLPVKKRSCFGLLAVVKKIESFCANFT